MSQRRRLFLTGSERAEFEHIFGPLTVDQSDPRFVLVDEETEAKIAALPPGVPVRQGQHPQDIAAVRAAELDSFEDAGAEDVGEEAQGKGALAAKPLDVEPAADAAGDDSAGEAPAAAGKKTKPEGATKVPDSATDKDNENK
jgi:hypothetical protein